VVGFCCSGGPSLKAVKSAQTMEGSKWGLTGPWDPLHDTCYFLGANGTWPRSTPSAVFIRQGSAPSLDGSGFCQMENGSADYVS